MKTKKKDALDILSELAGAGCGITVTLVHKEEGSRIDGKKLDSFLKDKKNLSKKWDLVSAKVSIPKQETEEVEYAAETVLNDTSAD